jgi:5-methylcytosine-specific restriction endonuclease McrA
MLGGGQRVSGSTRQWRKLRAQVIAEEPRCWLHLDEQCTVLSTTADHIIPKVTRPELAMVRANLRGSCAHCNYRRRHRPLATIDELRSTPTQSTNTKTQRAQHKALDFFDCDSRTPFAVRRSIPREFPDLENPSGQRF